jgi:hypothetical protein
MPSLFSTLLPIIRPVMGLLLSLPLVYQTACADELWLVELEQQDGITLQFQGAELELGSADMGEMTLERLRPGARLAILSRDGIVLQIRPRSSWHANEQGHWQRAEANLLAVAGHRLTLQALGTVEILPQTRWRNGGPADLQQGRRLVLSRDAEGRLLEILIPNPEE